MIKGAIYYKNYELAQRQVDKIIEQYRLFRDIDTYTRSKEQVKFSNGDCWKLISANYLHHGFRCNIAYIERSIDEEYFYHIIIPCLSQPPFSAFNFYGEGDLRVSDQVELPF